VEVALTGEEALTAMQEAPPDLLILDLYLPDMPGMKVLNRMAERSETATVPVLVTTAVDMEWSTLAHLRAKWPSGSSSSP
jgi:adenylate cyclase